MVEKAKLKMVFICCECGHRYSITEGLVDPKDWKNGYSEKILEFGKLKELNHFPIECPKCGLRHALVMFPLPWEESPSKDIRDLRLKVHARTRGMKHMHLNHRLRRRQRVWKTNRQ